MSATIYPTKSLIDKVSYSFEKGKEIFVPKLGLHNIMETI
jgi:hypothetical protein